MQNLNPSRWLHRWAIPASIFWLAFLPRAIYPVSRTLLWYERALLFGDALLAGDWAGTYQRYHPGVTTMWLSGASLKLFARLRGLSPEQMWGSVPTKPGMLNDAIAAGVLPLALVVALCIALSYPLIRRLVDKKVALAGSLLLALDPFHLALSKVLHVDALVATFMLMSVLLLLNFLHQARRRDLVLSGAFAGLSFLSKSSSLFLVPFAALAVGACEWIAPGLPRGMSAGWRGRLWRTTWILLFWGGVSAVAFVVLWPAMWVEPLQVLRGVGERIVFHVETVHRNPVFFAGQITLDDPGPFFYLATIAWKTTIVTLPAACAITILALVRLGRGKHGRFVWLLIAYVVFFTAQMGLSSRKELRYLLPVFPALDLLAAFGLVECARALGRARGCMKRRWVPMGCVVLAVALQAAVVLPRHPYYSTHHNALLGGSKVAQHLLPLQDQGEGLDLAAQHLNTLPRAQGARAALHPRGTAVFQRNFLGLTSDFGAPWINYRVYFVNQIMRRLHSPKWEEAWQADRQTAPLWSVAFDGVTYVWVYGAPPEAPAAGGPEYEVDYRLGEHIDLQRVRLSAETLAPGDSLVVALIWTSDGEVETEYMVFCHLLSASGELVAQRDGPPLYGVRPTSTWLAGEVMEDSYEIFLGSDLAPGDYELSVGMYDPESMERLPAYSAAGERLSEDRIVLGSVRIKAPEASGQ
jgi:hypothetical protein